MINRNQLNIAIVYGGQSCEHEISVITACLAKGYFGGRLFSVYIDKHNVPYLVDNDLTPKAHMTFRPKNRVVFLQGQGAIGVVRRRRIRVQPIDVVVNCCHGLNGEDGCIAALCQLSGIPLVGSDVASSAVAMDKVLTKRVLSACGFPVLEGQSLANGQPLPPKLTYPLIVKPSKLGSSIGVKVAHDIQQLQLALQTAFKYCSTVLIEPALTHFTELNCAALRAQGKVAVSNVDSPVTLNELLTFDDKYICNNATKKSSDTVSEELITEVRTLTAQIYDKLGFGGVIRVDFLLDNQTGKLYVNEINTTPGSLALGLWEGIFSRTQYGEALVDQAVADYRQLQSYTYSFSSGVLDGNGCKKK